MFTFCCLISSMLVYLLAEIHSRQEGAKVMADTKKEQERDELHRANLGRYQDLRDEWEHVKKIINSRQSR